MRSPRPSPLCSANLTARPVIPVFINCITKPFVPFRRTRLLGQAIGRFALTLNRRVLFLASGGMSHHPTRYYPEHGAGEPAVEAWKLSGGDDPGSLTPAQWLDRLEVMHHEGAGMIARGERTAKDMRLNAQSDRRFLGLLTQNRLEEYDDWDQDQLVETGRHRLHGTCMPGLPPQPAHKSAGRQYAGPGFLQCYAGTGYRSRHCSRRLTGWYSFNLILPYSAPRQPSCGSPSRPGTRCGSALPQPHSVPIPNSLTYSRATWMRCMSPSWSSW